MQPSVLQPVDRRRLRRRRHRPGRIIALVLFVLVAGTAASFAMATFGQHEAKAVRARPLPPRAAVRPRPQPKPKPSPLLTTAFRPHRLELSARAAILVDARTGNAIWGKRPHARRRIASTTKIMTAVLALERLRGGQLVRISPLVPRAAPNREGLRTGERVRAWKLLYGLMLYSGNDDALALAIAAGGTRARFIALMNAKARQLQLLDTRFSTPSGVVDRGNRSSAWDLAALSRYAMRKPAFRRIVRTRIAHVRWSAPTYEKVYVNKNDLLRTYRGADGVKTGWTTLAGHCLVASARRGRARLIAVVLGSADPYRDARRLLNYGFKTVPG
jgi:serine-type D-Ala-D-Ala carboxypeptidase (penicillin-binding protein 5/6)